MKYDLESKIVYLEALGRPMLVVNDANIAKDLLEKRSGLYSSRYAYDCDVWWLLLSC